ncbi:unnamed protein product [Tetraodon nigroviridis]|uniref:(spotted green pufferfish) hypothetical protein n=2 Tax=Tetraodon nigroviridis TaxID=99883 RepID=Q4T7S2_TETNG|nr:unnamed protein product [Tetraodon nigroviridis]
MSLLTAAKARAPPIRRCLDLGADVVITGRCVDSALALGPLMHTFNWQKTDYDLLAAGRDNVGFPVVECSSDGSFVLSKPPNTGGLVSFGTVAEQLVYEIGDPRRYLLPDVTCDFSQVTIQEVCATYMDGFRATAVCPVAGPHAAEKARRTAASIIKRMRRIFPQVGLQDFSRVNAQVLGAEDLYGAKACTEVTLCSPVLKPFFFLHPKSEVKLDIHLDGQVVESLTEAGPDAPVPEAPPSWVDDEPADLPSGTHSYRLEQLAYTRSGDKGDSANIGSVGWDMLNQDGQRYTLPGVHGLNFVLQSSLGGGGVASLRSDPQVTHTH